VRQAKCLFVFGLTRDVQALNNGDLVQKKDFARQVYQLQLNLQLNFVLHSPRRVNLANGARILADFALVLSSQRNGRADSEEDDDDLLKLNLQLNFVLHSPRRVNLANGARILADFALVLSCQRNS
jgi:hypothetical protein